MTGTFTFCMSTCLLNAGGKFVVLSLRVSTLVDRTGILATAEKHSTCYMKWRSNNAVQNANRSDKHQVNLQRSWTMVPHMYSRDSRAYD